MAITYLGDRDVELLLESLTSQEACMLSDALLSALKEYSASSQSLEGGAAAFFPQPERAIVQSPITGATTLFMPSYSPAGYGFKGTQERLFSQCYKRV